MGNMELVLYGERHIHLAHLRQLHDHLATLPMRSVVFLQAAWRAHIRRRIMLRAAKEAAAMSHAKSPPAPLELPAEPEPLAQQERLPAPRHSLGGEAAEPTDSPISPSPLPRGALSAFAAAAESPSPPPAKQSAKAAAGMAALPGMA